MTESQKQLVEAAQEVCEWFDCHYFDGLWREVGEQKCKLKSALEAVKKESNEV